MKPFFSISLDFELFWGVKDKRTIAAYGQNILGVRQAIPAMLQLFKQHQIGVTWATVGMLLFRNKSELLAYIPETRAKYRNHQLDPYATLNKVGNDENSDPYHFGYSLVRQIQETPGMEIGSHTFGHFNCLEEGATPQAFQADIEMAKLAFGHFGITPKSLVFPRNQYNTTSLQIAKAAGIRVFRGNPDHSFYSSEAQSEESKAKRLGRLLDSYINVTGHLLTSPNVEEGMLNVPASRFLRPYSKKLASLTEWQVSRICNSMTAAAKTGQGFHLWWHPHNFGANLTENMRILQQIVWHYATLREQYDMLSMTMSDVYEAHQAVFLSNTSHHAS